MQQVVNYDIPLLSYFRVRFFLCLFNITPNHDKFTFLRNYFLRISGFKIGNRVKIFSPLNISPKTFPGNILIGDNVFINVNSRFSVPSNARVSLGANVLIGPNVTFETLNHFIEYKAGRHRGANVGNITIQEGVWIGCNSMILQDVTIGMGSVVAAGSVVTKDIMENVVVGGVPATIIKNAIEK